MRRQLALLAGLVTVLAAAPAQAATINVAPGANLNSVYQAAQPGDEIVCAAGAYGAQTINEDADKPDGSARVTFRCAGARLTGFVSFADDVTYRGFEAPSAAVTVRASRNVTVDGWKGMRFDIYGHSGDPLQNVTVSNGDWTLTSCAGDNHIAGPASDIRIVGNRMDDPRSGAQCPGKHLDCLHSFNGIDRLTVTGNRLTRCVHLGYLVNGSSNIVLENNFFWGGVVGLKLRSGATASGGQEVFTNVTIRHNSADGINMGAAGDNVLNGVVAEGNATGGELSCRTGVTYRGNLAGGTCSAGNFSGDPRFVNEANGDFRLSAGSPAIDRVATGPALDIDGQARPSGARFDVGADELAQAAPPPPPPPPDRDGDGFADGSDLCPDVTGQAPDGCPPPQPVYDPVCAPTCDTQIAVLTQERNQARAERDQARQQLAAAQALADARKAKLDRIAAILNE